MPSGYDVNTGFMSVTVFYSCFLTVTQWLSDNWNSKQGRSRATVAIYLVYMSSVLCAVQCFLMHNSHRFPEWYCKYGMGVCIILYSLEKSCMYTFFLIRARITQGYLAVFPPIVFNRILPLWIVVYIVSFAVMCPLFYRGVVAHPSQPGIVTGCLFTHNFPYLFLFASMVDVCNCVGFLLLFCLPWRKAIKMTESAFNKDNTAKNEFLVVVRWNIALSAICCASSVSFCLFMSITSRALRQYAWLGGNIDMTVNMTAVFLMLATNRLFCRRLYMNTCGGLGSADQSHLALSVVQISSVHTSHLSHTRKSSRAASHPSTVQMPRLDAANTSSSSSSFPKKEPIVVNVAENV